MDTVQEEPFSEVADSSPMMPCSRPPSYPPSRRATMDSMDAEGQRHINSNSRRPSAIIAALRRPSQTLALTAAHTVMRQRTLLLDLIHGGHHTEDRTQDEAKDQGQHPDRNKPDNDALTTAVSALYAKLVVVLGIAFPVTEIVSLRVPASFYQGFYLFLYSGSVMFLMFVYATLIREKTVFSIKKSVHDKDKSLHEFHHRKEVRPVIRYGSNYLRLGAIAFGIGSMVYSGLEFGQYFELKKESRCNNVLIALTPAVRMVLTIVQMQFIFLNTPGLTEDHMIDIKKLLKTDAGVTRRSSNIRSSNDDDVIIFELDDDIPVSGLRLVHLRIDHEREDISDRASRRVARLINDEPVRMGSQLATNTLRHQKPQTNKFTNRGDAPGVLEDQPRSPNPVINALSSNKTTQMKLNRYKTMVRFGMMHIIATNLCEWLYVLVEETKHEIVHLEHASFAVLPPISSEEIYNSSNSSGNSSSQENPAASFHHDIYECQRTNIMGSLVQNASPFLFPCTIEYSLICAVILFEMWKKICIKKNPEKKLKKCPIPAPIRGNHSKSRDGSMTHEKLAQAFTYLFAGPRAPRSSHHFSVDCAGAHRGLFSGIIVIVMTIISLIMFFVLNKEPSLTGMAVFEVNICELILYTVTLIAVVLAMVQIRDLKYVMKKGGRASTLVLDTTLLVMAQAGVFIYCMFSIIGCYFTMGDPDTSGVTGLVAELFSLIQTVFQTMFILDGWWRRCRSAEQARRKPGRQVITFLLVANMAMWTVNTLEKNRAEFRPTHLKFFGVWAWTIITHVSMPMAIFYRFHSTICLFEIWKTAYKIKQERH